MCAHSQYTLHKRNPSEMILFLVRLKTHTQTYGDEREPQLTQWNGNCFTYFDKNQYENVMLLKLSIVLILTFCVQL